MSTTSERFSFPLTDSEEDKNYAASQLRHDAIQELSPLEFLSEDQREDITLAVGEAGTNAVKHALLKDNEEECVTCEVVKADDSFAVKITNPSDDLSTETPSLPESSEEEGRGRFVIDKIVQDLCQSGLEAQYSFCFEPQENHSGRAIFSLSVRH